MNLFSFSFVKKKSTILTCGEQGVVFDNDGVKVLGDHGKGC